MRFCLLLGAAALTVMAAGCQSSDRDQAARSCAAKGRVQGTFAYDDCIGAELAVWQQQRERANRAGSGP